MNKKASQWSFVLGAIGLIIGIGCLYLLFTIGHKPVKDVDRCANEYCTTTDALGCPQDKGEPYYPSSLKCDDNTRKCCTPASDPLSIDAKAREKQGTLQTNNNQIITPQNQGSAGKINIFMNDGFQDLSSSSGLSLEIGKTYAFHILGVGANSDNCVIQVLDASNSKVTAGWVQGAVGTMSCVASVNVMINPNDWSLSNQRYTLEVALVNKTTNAVTARSTIGFAFVVSSQSGNVVAKT